MQSTLLLATVVAFVGAAFVWPTIRLWRYHGVWPIVLAREAAPAQRLLGWLGDGLLAIVLGASVGRVVLGPDRLGLVSVPVGVTAIGWSLLYGGALLTLLAQGHMGASWRVGIDDRPTDLVTGGAFQLVRNPIFSGLLLFLAGYFLLMPAWWSLTLWAATAAGLRVQIALEERHLVALHGARYVAYASRVGRLVPLVGRLKGPPAPSSRSHGRS